MDKWKAELLVKMRMNKITQRALAKHLGLTEEYISMVFNGFKTPKNAEERITCAINEIIAERQSNSQDTQKQLDRR